MSGNMKEAFLSAPADQIDQIVRDAIEKWDDVDPTSLQVLEAIDIAIHGANASDLAVGLMQQFYDTLLKKEGKTHEDNVPLATWRTK